jgi:hypothetical protein
VKSRSEQASLKLTASFLLAFHSWAQCAAITVRSGENRQQIHLFNCVTGKWPKLTLVTGEPSNAHKVLVAAERS